MIINLKHYYEHITDDEFVEVTQEQFDVFKEFERKENALERQMYRYRGQYSLDADDGTENKALKNSIALEELFELKISKEQLKKALAQLPEKQARRIEAYFFFGMSKTQIAEAEGVDKSAVLRSINSGLKILKRNLKKFAD